jgi:hypothetical protein
MKPICIPCQRFFRPHKTGFFFTEGMPVGSESAVPSGTSRPDLWKPYKIWSGDIWKCEGCGAEIVVGFGTAKSLGADQYQVNDC